MSFTKDELEAMIARGEDVTDWAYVDSLTEEELEASIDPEDEGESTGLIIQGFPHPKREITVQIDGDLIDWFDDPDDGPGPRINAVLRGYVEGQKWEAWAKRRADDIRARKGEAA